MTVSDPDSSEMTVPEGHVAFSIDGVSMTAEKGTLIIRAAEQLGIEIPRFCDHPLLDPVAACRMCLIEIEGQPKPQPACAIPVADNMIVLGDFGCWSDSEHVWLHAFGKDLKQRAVIDHPGRCLPESRAQAINFAAQPEGESIVMVWPTAEVIRSPTEERPVAMHFLTLNGDEVKETGIVPMDDGPAPVPTESNDWYGNTRTVIIGERIFLLSGDLLKEVRHSTSGVREVGRVALPRQTDD